MQTYPDIAVHLNWQAGQGDHWSEKQGNSGGAAEIHSSGGRIRQHDNVMTMSCTPQIGPLWKSGKKKAIVETKV